MPGQHTRIVVTGIGAVTPLGIGKEAVLQGLRSRKSGLSLRKTKLSGGFWDESYVHSVDGFDITQFGIDADALDYIKNWKEGEHNRDLLFLLAAVKLAVDDGGVDRKDKNSNLSLVVTHENPGLEQCLMRTYQTAFDLYKNTKGLCERDFYDQIFQKTTKLGYESQSFMTLFHIARTFQIKQYSLLINNACASGLYAVEAASDLIRTGKSRQVVVAAGDCPDALKTIWLKSINMYQEDGKIKPFDKEAKGFVMGEGSVALIIEDYEYAKKRGAHIYAEYLGGGFRLEGWGITTPMIGGQSYQDAIRDALNSSGLKAADVELVCAHGVGTPSSDYYEAKAISDVFGRSSVPVTALKPFVGHNLGGSNLMELAVLLFSLGNKKIPPVLNITEPNAELGLDLVLEEKETQVNTFMKTCCAFAGYNAAAVFRRGNIKG